MFGSFMIFSLLVGRRPRPSFAVRSRPARMRRSRLWLLQTGRFVFVRRSPMLRARRISGNIHGQVVNTCPVAQGICECVQTIAIVIYAVSRLERMRHSINGEQQSTFLDRDVFART